VITKGLEEMDWRQYHLEQRGGRGIPVGPVMVIIHIASTNIPFTSESKEAIANLDVIKTEVQLAVRECARRMRTHIKRRKKLKKMVEKYSIIQKLLPEIARKSSEIVGLPLPDIAKVITNIMNVVVVEDRIVYEKREGPDFINTPGNVQSRLLQFDEEHTPPDRDGSDGREKRTKWTTKSYITVTNYTPKKKSITMYVKIPQCLVTNIIPKPRSQGERVIIWDLKNIGPTASELLCFEIMDLDKGDYDKNEVFFSGTTGEVIGAEKMHF
jgi:hypothetical protein